MSIRHVIAADVSAIQVLRGALCAAWLLPGVALEGLVLLHHPPLEAFTLEVAVSRSQTVNFRKSASGPKAVEPRDFVCDINLHIDLESDVNLGRQQTASDTPVLCRRLDQKHACLLARHASGFKVIGNSSEQRALGFN